MGAQPGPRNELRPLEAHVLLILATYADKNAIAWPSIATLAHDAGLKVKVVERPGRRASRGNSAISAALVRLHPLRRDCHHKATFPGI